MKYTAIKMQIKHRNFCLNRYTQYTATI